MIEGLPDAALERLSEFVATHMGLRFPRERWRDLERGVVAASREFDFRDASSCVEWLTTSLLTRKQIEVLASHLTVGETYFFRERKTFQHLEEQILPPLIQSRREADRRLRIWSAGCATGEEAFSVAILLRRLLPDLESWHVTILATDINPRFLQKGREAVYGQWSFRESTPSPPENSFEKHGEGKLRVMSRIRKLVEFAYLNLAEDAYPSLLTKTNAMDIIFCRNVLMYFSFEQARRTVEKLHRSLVDGGWLLVSPCEASHVLFSQFSAVSFPGTVVYRKEACQTSPVVGMPHQEPAHLEESLSLTDDPITAPEPAAPPIEESSGSLLTGRVAEHQEKANSTACQDALALVEQGCYPEAVEVLLAHLEEVSGDADAMALLARAYANQGRLEEARSWCEQAITTDKLRAAPHYLQAAILQEQGDDSAAADALGRALYLDQNFVLAHVALGHLRRRHGKLGESRKHFQNALGLLQQRPAEELVPESEGITTGRLTEIIQATV
jgi:chemotaxis protein methyltransferase CheR